MSLCNNWQHWWVATDWLMLLHGSAVLYQTVP